MTLELYKDGTVTITTPELPAKKGHLTVKSAKQSMDELSEDDFAHLCSAALFSSNALFELGGAEGTNIIIDDLGSLKAHVITRTNDDKLKLQWDAKPADQQALDEASSKIKDKCDYIDAEPAEKEASTPAETPVREKEPDKEPEEDEGSDRVRNYLLDKLDRLP
ncbi:hypothetical protein KY327_01175 [Candidatus Woesearchaeota archaeon]|nr:hypothetical protein [Candidatus Woesearchaeota archaeon]